MFYKLEAQALILSVKVSANAIKSEFKKQRTEDYLEIRVAGVRDKGKANIELIAYLSSKLGVPKSHIDILSGSTAPHKKIRVSTPEPAKILALLNTLLSH
ncbi:MAG: DUF167 domain-containing protein [Bdellovibrionaceae bacterium]|nr:DUF167 domain-containing protein [Pseudobdellovibrionaceae bacterium]